METNKTVAIIGTTLIIMFFGTFWILFISDAWINTPTNYTINFNMDNETKEALIKLSEMPTQTKCVVKEYEYGVLQREFITDDCIIVNGNNTN